MTDQDVKEQLSHFSKRFNIEREKFENEIMEMLEDITDNTNPEETNKIETSG
jgi:gas vesicle protein